MTKSGFRDKDRVIAVNGESVIDWMNRNEKYVAASTPLNRRLFAAANIFRSLFDTTRDYTVCRGNDTIEINLPLLPNDSLPSSVSAKTDSKVLNDNIGYLAINTMMDGVIEKFLFLNSIKSAICHTLSLMFAITRVAIVAMDGN